MGLLPTLLNALGTTLFISVTSLFICLIPGLILYLGKRSRIKIAYLISASYIEFFEGIPLLAQLFFAYYGLSLISPNLMLSQTFAAIAVLSLNGAAGIASYAKLYSSMEDKTFDVKQVLKVFILSAIKVLSELIKYSTLLSIIGMTELFRAANTITSAKGDVTAVIIAIGIYLLLNILLKICFKIIQKVMHTDRISMT